MCCYSNCHTANLGGFPQRSYVLSRTHSIGRAVNLEAPNTIIQQAGKMRQQISGRSSSDVLSHLVKNITHPVEDHTPRPARTPRLVPSFPFHRSVTRPRSICQGFSRPHLRHAGTPRKKKVCALGRQGRGADQAVRDGVTC